MGQEEEPEQRYLDAADEFLKGLQRNENGKPEIPGFAHFSVSHTGDIWAAAFAEVPIGLDVQEKREVRYGAIAEKFYSDAEKDAVVKSGSPKEIFYTIWARKEALVKAAGGKLFMEMPDVVCGDGGEIPPEIEMLGRKWKTEDLIFTDDTAAAVCFEIRGERPI